MSQRIIAGPRAVGEALKRRGGLVELWHDDNGKRHPSVEQAKQRGVEVRRASTEELDALVHAVDPGLKHQGLVGLASEYQYSTLEEILARAGSEPRIIVLDEITDPHNLGAIIRSAVALGIDGILLPKRRSAHVTPAVVRVSAGATEHASIALVTNIAKTLADLSDRGIQCVGLAAEGSADIRKLPEAGLGRAIVVGAEGKGLRRLVRERCDLLARIEMGGPIASLNASVAAAIALFATMTPTPSDA